MVDGVGDVQVPRDLGAPQTSRTTLESKPYDPGKEQDTARKWIAYSLIALTTLVVIGGFILAAFAINPDGPPAENLKTVLSLLNVVFGPIVALLGSATGFYFGANSMTRTGGST